MNDPGVEWVQVLREYDDDEREWSHDNKIVRLTSDSRSPNQRIDWAYPRRTHYLHIGKYSKRQQLTVIAHRIKYPREDGFDTLGKRIASGTAEAMYAMMQDYARML